MDMVCSSFKEVCTYYFSLCWNFVHNEISVCASQIRCVGGILFKILGRENWYLLDYEHCYYITANRVKIRNGGDFGRDSEVKSCSNGA